jgi:hypothetical protein
MFVFKNANLKFTNAETLYNPIFLFSNSEKLFLAESITTYFREIQD